jgi:hypothetical protein
MSLRKVARQQRAPEPGFGIRDSGFGIRDSGFGKSLGQAVELTNLESLISNF